MAFPDTPLSITTELYVGGTWTNITSDVYARDQIRITRGRSEEGKQVDPGRCLMTLNNRAGKYSPRNPTGPYYGQIGRNTPIRLSVSAGTPYMNIADTSGDRASTPDNAALDITGDIDLRIEATLDDWVSTTPATCLLGKYNATAQRSYRLVVQSSHLFFSWATTGADFLERSSTVSIVVPPSRRLAVRATLDVDNGAAGHTVTFYTSTSISGTWVQLGDPVVTAGVTSIFAGTAPLDVGQIQTATSFNAPVGQIHAAQVRSGIGGTVVANPDFTAQAVGATSFTDSAGRTWTLAGDASIINRKVRFVGEVPDWPIEWDTSGRDIYTQIQAAGILRRLGQGASPLASTLRRRLPSGSNLIAYWPMEDASGSTQAYSPITGVAPIKPTGLSWAAIDTLPGSSALPELGSTASLLARPPKSAATTWHVELVYNLPTLPAAAEVMLRVDLASGTIGYTQIKVSTTGTTIEVYGPTGTLLVTDTSAAGISSFAGVWSRLQVFSYASGGSAYVTFAWRDVITSSWWYHSVAVAGTHGPISSVSGNWGSSWQGMSIGHLGIFTAAATNFDAPGVTVYESADDGFSGEYAGSRILRLAAEESVSAVVYGAPTSLYGPTLLEERMGAQRPNTLLTLMQEAADSDHGILYEERTAAKLAYRDRNGLTNQPVAATLNYPTRGHIMPPLRPVDDDQLVRNDITVQRINGSFGRATLDTGALSTAAPPSGVGRYTDSVSMSLYSDDQPYIHAGWLLHLGTVDEARYPVVNVSLQAATSLIDAVTALDCGARLQITNPPSKLPPGTIDLLVQGYTETLAQYQWDLTLTCTPASPYTVAVTDDVVLGRCDTDGSQLAAGVNASATSLSVAITAGPLWTTSAPEFPFDVLIGGERMTVTNITGAASPQTFTVTRSVNGVSKAQSSGADVRLYQAAYAAL